MNIPSVIPAQYQLAVKVGVVIVIIGLIFGYGFATGISWNADDLAMCRANIDKVKEVQDALEKKGVAARLESARIIKETGDGWAAAVAWLNGHPRTVRVSGATQCAPGGLRPVPATPASPDAAAVEPRFSEAGATAEITIEEINSRLNKAEHDAAQVMHLIAFIQYQHERQR